MYPELSASAASAWAKHDRDSDSAMALFQHMADSASVAQHLWDHWLPASVRRIVADCFPDDEHDARIAVSWLSCVHDLGKCSGVFATQVPALAGAMEAAGLPMPLVTKEDRRRFPHSIVSHILVRCWLVDRFGWDQSVADSYAVVTGGHHGVPPSYRDLETASATQRLLGGPSWADAQNELADYCARISGAQSRLNDWAAHPLTEQAQVLVTAVVILADWIASNQELFPYTVARSDTDQSVRTKLALAALALPARRQVGPPPAIDRLFSERFELPLDAKPRPVQAAAFEAALQIDDPGLMIIEAGMGEGKTEAALVAAEALAYRTGAGGFFVALPTMATSDAMFRRVLDWAERLPSGQSDGPQSMYLAHSKSRLNDDFTALPYEAIRGIGTDEERSEDCTGHHDMVAHQWLFGRKKGVLADVVVGTIDQILFAALKSRHLVLRHLALANKVVILDELHALDTFMNVYMDRVLEWLGSYQIPTIVLSATLPADRRIHLLQAYETGQRREREEAPTTPRRRRRSSTAPVATRYDALTGDIGYPVITATTSAEPLVRAVEPSDRSIPVTVELSSDDDDALVALLRSALRDGGCAAVIRNTVGRAQQTKQLLDQHFPSEVTLAHSRFVATDRLSREAALRRDLGPASGRGSGRPTRRIVVGTQVLEQSLDVDFDLMVTDLAPLDLVLQRAGRLHRHHRPVSDRPSGVREPRLVMTGVEDWSAVPVAAVKGSRAVYGDMALLRSAAVLLAHTSTTPTVTLPCDVAGLVQAAYSSKLGPPNGWEVAWESADTEEAEHRGDQQSRAKNFLLDAPSRRARASTLVGWIDRGVGEADDSGQGRAQVRDSEDGIEVIVVQRVDGQLRSLPWLDRHAGELLDSGIGMPSALARTLATCTLRLPPLLTKPWVIDKVISELEANGLASWQNSPWLAGELVLVLDEDLGAEIAGFHLEYDHELGLLLNTNHEENGR